MQITTTIPDEAIPAWQLRVDQFNAGSGQPPVDIKTFAQINRDVETASYSETYARWQLEQLAPLGERYNAAPKDVQKKVDALLQPY